MKISQVTAVPLSIPFQHGLGSGRRLDLCLVRVDTDAKDRLWASACASHEAWMATRAESEVSAVDVDDADASARGSG